MLRRRRSAGQRRTIHHPAELRSAALTPVWPASHCSISSQKRRRPLRCCLTMTAPALIATNCPPTPTRFPARLPAARLRSPDSDNSLQMRSLRPASDEFSAASQLSLKASGHSPVRRDPERFSAGMVLIQRAEEFICSVAFICYAQPCWPSR